MSYTYLLEQGEESWAECFSDIPASVLWRLNLTAEKSCSNGNATDAFPSSQSGMTLRRSTAINGAEELIWYAGDSPVRTYLPSAKEKESEAKEAGCGPSSPGSLAKFNPALYGWKTAQCSLFGGLEWFAETWPRWGMMRDGELFPLPTPELRTLENESGFSQEKFPTPQANEIENPNKEYRSSRNAYKGNKKVQPMLADVVRIWPTPSANNYEQKDIGALLERRERCKAKHKNGNGFGMTLGNAVKLWPTPTQRDYKDGKTPRIRGGIIQMDTLGRRVFATPTKSDYRSPNMNPAKNGQTEPASGHALPAQIGGQLNPNWVEWLMGWPIGWTDLKPLEMDKFQQWLNSHGKY